MVLFLFGTISVFCNAQIDGYYVKDSGNLALLRMENLELVLQLVLKLGNQWKFVLLNLLLEISLWQKISGSDYIQFNPGGSGRFALIWTQGASKGDSAVLCHRQEW